LHHGEKTYFIESLGCNKNIVDSEIIMTLLKERGYRRVEKPEDADRIIVNTCAFIDEAKQEAIDTILALSRMKRQHARLVVTGCFPQIYSVEIEKQMPEVDTITGSGNLSAVVDAIDSDGEQKSFPHSRTIPDRYTAARRTDFITLRGFAYQKISEGCSRSCSFCLIPHIKGRMRSRSIGEILDEIRDLEQRGVKELILTSQDTLSYGLDFEERSSLKELLRRITGETAIPLIRLLYLRPATALLGILDLFENRRILPYFDIPIQHVSKKILKNMNREGDSRYYEKVIGRIRDRIPHAVFRTTLITGFPGEGEEEFEELLGFVERIKFNHVGVFTYSPQRETRASALRDRVKGRIAEERREVILARQREISHSLLEAETGKSFDVLIEERVQGEDLYLGRSYHFAPEVDGLFVVRTATELGPGSLVKAKVTAADDYDLHGIV